MQVIDEISHETPKTTYHPRWLILRIISLCLVLCIFLTLGTLAVAEEGFEVGAIFLFLGAIFFLVLGVLAILGSSDIVVNSIGISSVLFGIKVNEIYWLDVSVIRSFPVCGGAGGRRGVFGYNIVTRSPSHKGRRRWKIWFSENPNDIQELISTINFYARSYGILVEKTANGITTASSSL